MRASMDEKSEPMQAVAKSNQLFNGKLYPVLVKATGKDQNMILSPFSISSILSMAMGGAKEETVCQLRNVMGLPTDDIVIHQGYKEVTAATRDVKEVTLSVANRLFVQDGYPILEDYINFTDNHYEAKPESVDYCNSSEASKRINKWVEEKTQEKIKNLIDPSAVGASTRLVLVNAIYFKGTWESKFQKEATQVKKFNISATRSVDVDMMHITDDFCGTFCKDLDCHILQLPYMGDRLSMLLLLPTKADQFLDLEQNLATVNLADWKMDPATEYDVALPKFKLETMHKLVKPLKALGVVDIFDQSKSNLSGISAEPLYASSVVQKAFIEVNEEGSEAAAATAMVANYCCFVEPGPKREFICDRPFLFAIKDDLTGLILFNGRVVNPLSN